MNVLPLSVNIDLSNSSFFVIIMKKVEVEIEKIKIVFVSQQSKACLSCLG